MKQQKKHQHLAYLEYQRKRQAELLKFIHGFTYKKVPSLQTKKSVRNIVATITKDSERLDEQIFPYLHKTTSIDKSIDESFFVEKMETDDRYAQTPWIDIDFEFNSLKNTSTTGTHQPQLRSITSQTIMKSILQIQSAPASPQVLKEELEMATILREASKLSIGRSSPGVSCVDLRYQRETQKIPASPRNLSMDSAVNLSAEPSLIDLDASSAKSIPNDDSAINVGQSAGELTELPASPSDIMNDILKSYSNPISPRLTPESGRLTPESGRSPIDNLHYIVDADDQYFEDILTDKSPKHVMKARDISINQIIAEDNFISKDIVRDLPEFKNVLPPQVESNQEISYIISSKEVDNNSSDNSPIAELKSSPTISELSNHKDESRDLNKKQPSIPKETTDATSKDVIYSELSNKQPEAIFTLETENTIIEESPSNSRFSTSNPDELVQLNKEFSIDDVHDSSIVAADKIQITSTTNDHHDLIVHSDNQITFMQISDDSKIPLHSPIITSPNVSVLEEFENNKLKSADSPTNIANEIAHEEEFQELKQEPRVDLPDLPNLREIELVVELSEDFEKEPIIASTTVVSSGDDKQKSSELEPLTATFEAVQNSGTNEEAISKAANISTLELGSEEETPILEEDYLAANEGISPTLDYALYDSPLKELLESSTNAESPDITMTDSAIAESEPVFTRGDVKYIPRLSSTGMNATSSQSNASTMVQEFTKNDEIANQDKDDHNDLISSIIQNVLKLEKYEDDMLKNYMEIKSKIDEISERLNKLEDVELSDLLGQVISQIGMFKSNIVKNSKNVDFLGLIDKEEQKLKKTVRFRLPQLQHDTLSDSMSNHSIRTAPQNVTKRQSISSNAASFDGTFKSKFVKTFKKPLLGKSERIKDRAFNITYYIYRPNLKDPLDVVFAKTVNSMLLTFPITFLSKGKYRFDASDTKIINIKMRGPDVMVRVGGGYITLIEFFEKGYFKNMMLRHKLIQGFTQ